MDPNIFRYSSYETVFWTAEGTLDGRIAYGDNPPIQLYSYQGLYERKRKPPPWVMNLNRIDKKF
jgi:hypothetical protein